MAISKRPKLGLALSGGGGRASFFHLGVLRRLAELDLLRHVNVLSSVSGGSIIAAHYMLRLRHGLERAQHRLTADDYRAIVSLVEREFRRGISKNLRTRLLWNPLANIRMLCTRFSPGRRMARLLQRHLYREAAHDCHPGWDKHVPLRDLRFRLGLEVAEARGAGSTEPGAVREPGEHAEIEAYNMAAHDCIPKWVINSTCLNTGREFRFTAAEIGDPQLGYIRFDEAPMIVAYKDLLTLGRRSKAEVPLSRLLDQVRNRSLAVGVLEDTCRFREGTDWHLAWWLAASAALEQEAWRAADPQASANTFHRAIERNRKRVTSEPSPVFDYLADRWDTSRRLVIAEARLLRQAKLAAWYLVEGRRRRPPVTGGYTEDEHLEHLWKAIEDIDRPTATELRRRFGSNGEVADGPARFQEFLIDLYSFRSAEAFSWTVAEELGRLTLAEAVAASANFPPILPPFTLFGIYDPQQVRPLALTDGGVYDNQGLTALFEEQCTHVIASDAGGLLREQERASGNRVGMMARIISSLMANVRDRQLRELRERQRVTAGLATVPDDLRSRYALRAVAFFHMLSNPNDAAPDDPKPLPPHPNAVAIAQLRTDLDAFHEIEVDALVYQGYQLADRFVRTFLARDFPMSSPEPQLPVQRHANPVAWSLREQRRAAQVLRAGRARFFRVFVRFPVLRRALYGALGIGFAAAYLSSDLSIASVGSWLGELIATVARWPLRVRAIAVPLEQPKTAWIALLGIAVLVTLLISWPRLEARLARLLTREWGLKAQGRASRFAASIGVWRRNVLWFAGLLPLWIAIAGSAVALVSYGLDRWTNR